MKRLLFVLLLLPQLSFAQYHAACFNLETNRHATVTTVGSTFTSDTTLTLGVRSEITGLSVSGRATLNSEDGFIRILLKDSYNYEYLVYENHLLLADSSIEDFQNIAIETQWLEKVTPQAIRIETHHATIQLNSYCYIMASSGNRMTSVSLASIEMAQRQYIINKLNANLERLNIPWRAGTTPVSKRSYEEKKSLFGENYPELYGYEYYIGGIFITPGDHATISQQGPISNRTSTFVSEWDWRNRHGKNWMTPVKSQWGCNACWAFAAVGALEAYVNLYYNRNLNYDLSEEDVIVCSGKLCNGANGGVAMSYIKNHGIVNEDCMSYHNDSMLKTCDQKCLDPTEQIFIDDYRKIYPDEAQIKQWLFKSPLTFEVNTVGWNHALVLVGYITLVEGQPLRFMTDSGMDETIIDSSMAGQTAWILKNSYGGGWENSGYSYAIFTNGIDSLYQPKGSITSSVYNDASIVCEDADGDGFYNWGVSDFRPTGTPFWVPNYKDGDDSDPTKGPFIYNSGICTGFLEEIDPDAVTTHVVSGDEWHVYTEEVYSHVRIPANATLTIKGYYQMFGHVNIYIESGGELVIDDGVVTNANIIMSSGGKLTIKNGGKLVMRTNTTFNPPVGAVIDITNGEIIRSNDF